VLDVADGAQRGPQLGTERGGDQAVEQAADLGSGQRDRAALTGMVAGLPAGGAAVAAQAIRNARASMARVMNRCQAVQVRTW
jgi:hypothetical protein